MLVEDMTRTSRAMVTKVARGMLEERISKTITSLVLKGKILTTARFITQRGTRGVLLPDNTDSKSGQPVIYVICEKHPVPIIPTIKVVEHNNSVLEFSPLDIT